MTTPLEAMQQAVDAIWNLTPSSVDAMDGADLSALASASTALRDAMARPEGVVGTVSVEHFRGCKSMANVDFQLSADLPAGTHYLYAQPLGAVTEEEAAAASSLYWDTDASLRGVLDAFLTSRRPV